MTLLQLLSDETAVLGVVVLVALVGLAFFGALVYAEHRKEMKLIEAGAYAEAQGERTWLLAAGLLLLALGVADLVQAALLGIVPENGITLSMLGVAALVYYYLRRRETRLERGRTVEEAGTAGDDATP